MKRKYTIQIYQKGNTHINTDETIEMDIWNNPGGTPPQRHWKYIRTQGYPSSSTQGKRKKPKQRKKDLSIDCGKRICNPIFWKIYDRCLQVSAATSYNGL